MNNNVNYKSHISSVFADWGRNLKVTIRTTDARWLPDTAHVRLPSIRVLDTTKPCLGGEHIRGGIKFPFALQQLCLFCFMSCLGMSHTWCVEFLNVYFFICSRFLKYQLDLLWEQVHYRPRSLLTVTVLIICNIVSEHTATILNRSRNVIQVT